MRETKKIVLPKSQKIVEIYTYLSQRGYEAIREPFLRDRKISFIEGKGVVEENSKEIEMKALAEANKANIKYMLYSFDGETGTPDELYDRVINYLGKKDYEFLVEKINETTKEDEEENIKKKSDDQT